MKKERLIALLLAVLIFAMAFVGCSGKPKNVEEYMDKVGTEELVGAIGEDSAMEISAEDNTLICTYTYDESMNVSDEAVLEVVVDALESGMQQQASAFESVADTLREAVEDQDVKIRVVFNTEDGTELYSCEFE